MFNLDMQKKIVAAAMFKGLGDRRFPMYPLLNAANAIAQQEATGQLFTMSEDGSAVPIGQQPQVLPTVQPQPDALVQLTQAVTVLVNKVDTLIEQTVDTTDVSESEGSRTSVNA
jgi:hypothetical protein|tara:strand:- start:1104 stop:1445 length:342 start_codon:yes stop_codon:yes gene_type:complete